jgi:hypothetical protein
MEPRPHSDLNRRILQVRLVVALSRQMHGSFVPALSGATRRLPAMPNRPMVQAGRMEAPRHA